MFPSVMVENIFVYLSQYKLLLESLQEFEEHRFPFFQKAEYVAFLQELYISRSQQGWGGQAGERIQNTPPEEIRLLALRLDYQIQEDYVTTYKGRQVGFLFYFQLPSSLYSYFLSLIEKCSQALHLQIYLSFINTYSFHLEFEII